jgi:hypothetical protein
MKRAYRRTSAAPPSLGLLLRAGVRGRDLHPGLLRQLLDRLDERQPALVGQEADRIAMRAAAEAVIKTLVVVDRERRGLFLVERTTRLPLAPGLLQFD